MKSCVTNVFAPATRVVFGNNATQDIAAYARSAGFKQAAIITDRGVLQAGLVDGIVALLHGAGIGTMTFDAVSANPRSTECALGAAAVIAAGAEVVIAVGGGSAMDAGKAIALVAANGGHIEDYVSSLGGQAALRPMIPLYAVPTTCGSGSEVSATALITVTVPRQKVALRHCQPALAFVDPLLVLHMPAQLTAATGMDALSHALEAFLSPYATVYTDMCAVQAIRLISTNLRMAVASTGDQRQAPLAAMMYAANMAGLALTARTGQIHAFAHTLGGVLDVPHAYAIAVMLPVVLRYNLRHLASRLAQVAPLLGQNTFGLTEQRAAESSIEALVQLRSALSLPTCLADLAVPAEAIPQLVNAAMGPEEAERRNRPVPCARTDVAAMFNLALSE